jgi:type I restriction enzyme S subunit
MLLADIEYLPLVSAKLAMSEKFSVLRVSQGMTLISCSGAIGRMVYARKEMDGCWSSQAVMKVSPAKLEILPGYLYAFLSSDLGRTLVQAKTYGAIVPQIEREHLVDLPVPRVDGSTEQRIHELVEHASANRSKFQDGITKASLIILEHIGLSDALLHDWNSSSQDLGFAATVNSSLTFRALNYSRRAQEVWDRLREVEHQTLGQICKNGFIGTGSRFKRIDCDPDFGSLLVGQKQAFFMRPAGRWISAARAPKGIFAKEETVMIASSGGLGEHDMYCRAVLVTGKWLDYAYTQHFMRVVSGDQLISGAYIYAFLRTEAAFRCLRSMSTGSMQQEIHIGILKNMPIPILPDPKVREIEALIRDSFVLRDQADALEDEARALLSASIEERIA